MADEVVARDAAADPRDRSAAASYLRVVCRGRSKLRGYRGWVSLDRQFFQLAAVVVFVDGEDEEEAAGAGLAGALVGACAGQVGVGWDGGEERSELAVGDREGA